MDELGWLLLWLGANFIVALIAGHRRGAGSGAILFIAMCGIALSAMIATSAGLADNVQTKLWALPLVAWLVLLGGFLWALSAPNSAQMAEREGTYGNLKKCPFCAEAIKKEAVKCKHCGSAMPADLET